MNPACIFVSCKISSKTKKLILKFQTLLMAKSFTKCNPQGLFLVLNPYQSIFVRSAKVKLLKETWLKHLHVGIFIAKNVQEAT